MKTRLLLFIFCVTAIHFNAQTIDIPDANFEQALIDLGWDTNGKNGNILQTDASQIDTLSIIYQDENLEEIKYPTEKIKDEANNYYKASKSINIKISDATGLAAMTNLKYLEIINSDLTTIDISNNTEIETLALYMHDIQILNTINQTKLKHAFVGGSSSFSGLYTANSPDIKFIDIRETTINSYYNYQDNESIETLLLADNEIENISFSRLPNLKTLWLGDNNLSSSLGIDVNTKLENLYLENNQFSWIGIRLNTALKDLDMSGNPITGLTPSENPNLEYLNISDTDITEIDLTKSMPLKTLAVENGILETLDLSGNVNLEQLLISENLFTDLDLVANTSLQALEILNTNLILLNLESNTLLTDISVQGNSSLTKINLNNGNNTAIETINLDNNTVLTCVQVDDESYAQSTWSTITSTLFNTDCGFVNEEDIVRIPDANFEQALIDLGWDKDGVNGYILKVDAEKIDKIKISTSYTDDAPEFPEAKTLFFNETTSINAIITDVTGIQQMPNLTHLEIENSNITTLDISNNIKLEKLHLSSENLGRINIQNLTELVALEIGLTTTMDYLDISKNTKLQYLHIYNTNLPEQDISKNLALEYFYLPNNSIRNIDYPDVAENVVELWVNGTRPNSSGLPLSVFPNLKILRLQGTSFSGSFNELLFLEELYLDNGSFEAIDVSSNTALKIISINNNQLEQLNVFNNTKLEEIYLSDNRLTEFDLSKNTALKIVEAKNMYSLQKVNLANGNNTAITLVDFTNNEESNLTCVEVDNVNYAQETWTNITSTTVYNLDCDFEELQDVVTIADANFELALIDLGYDTNGITGDILRTDAEKITSLDVSNPTENSNLPNVNSSIKSVSGVAEMINLIDLNISSNEIGSLNVSENSSLQAINLANNQLAILDITDLVNLKRLNISNNNVSSLDVANKVALEFLNVNGNTNLSTLVLNENTGLHYLNVDNTNLSAINTAEIPNVKSLKFRYTSVSSLDVSTNLQLETINARKSEIVTLDVSNNTKLDSLTLRSTKIATVDLSENTTLSYLVVSDNRELNTIDISKNINLNVFYADTLSIATVDVSKNINLKKLSVAYTGIDNIDVSINTNLEEFRTAGRNLTKVDLSKNTALKRVEIDFSNNLEQIILSNGANENIEYIDIWIGNNLNCIEVDDVSYAISNWSYGVQDTSLFNLDCSTVTTPEKIIISDAVFEQYLVDQGFDTDGLNGSITQQDAEKITSIRLQESPVASLAGIEAMINLESLDIASSNITSLDISKNLKLKELNVLNNKLTSLNVTNNIALETLIVSANEIDEINIENLTKLKNLQARDVKVNQSNFSNFPDLEILNVSGNSLTNVDISNNTKLISLALSTNELTELDISNNINLTSLSASNNMLTGVNVYNAISLQTIYLNNNTIVNFDISQNKKLTFLWLNDNNLERVNLKNGSQSLLKTINLKNNPNLTCVSVDDTNNIPQSWVSSTDSQTNFSLNCNSEWTVYTEDANLETQLLAIPGLNANNDNNITYEEALNFVGNLDLSNQNLTSIVGLEAFLNANSIDISGNSITDITNLLLGNTIVLYSKNSGKTKIISRKNTTGIKVLNVANNLIEEVDISKLTTITELNISNNKLTSLNLKNGNNEILETLDVTGNSNLQCIEVDNVATANANTNWKKDSTASYSTNCSIVLSTEDFLDSTISLYPNPVKQKLHITVADNILVQKVEVFNVIGNSVLTTQTKEINFSQFTNGVYFLRIKTDKGTITRKVIKN